MGQHPEGLGQPPLREGVGGIALVIDGKGRFKALVHQVGVKSCDLFGQHHAFVDDGTARQRTQIHPLNARLGRGFFNPAADDVQLAFKLLRIRAVFTADQDLFDLWPCRQRLFPQNRDVRGHMTPAIDVMAHPQHFGFYNGPAGFLRAKIGARQENLAHSDQLGRIGLVPRAADLVVEELDRNLHMNARAVTGFAIGIHSAPVPNGFQRVDPVFHHLARRLARNRHNQPDAARRMLVFGFVQAVGIHPSALCLFGGDPCFVIFGHDQDPPRDFATLWGRPSDDI